MRKLKIAILAAGVITGTAGMASAQVDQCNGNGFAGTAIGAIVGGTTGGVIANNVGRRSFRGGNFGRAGFGPGFNRFGSRGGFGFSGRRGNGALGAVIGAVVGGVAANQIAAARQRNCIQNLRKAQQFAHPQQGYASGHSGVPIDHNAARLGDPYGGRPVPVAPSQPTGYSHPAPQPQQHSYQTPSQSSIVTQPVVSSAEYCTRTDPHSHSTPTVHPVPAGGSYPITTGHHPVVIGPDPIPSGPAPIFSEPSPVITQSEPLAGGGFAPSCQVLDRRTTLPDGTIVTEPIEYCQYSPGGDWVPS